MRALSTAQGLSGNVYQSLMLRSADEPFTLYGLIAQSIETDAAREHVVFRLNPLARFSDGGAITAEDVAFTFALLKEKGRPQQRAALSLVKKIETPNPLTIRCDLTGANDRELPLTLALMPVLSHVHTDAAHFEEQTLQIPVSSGPYVVAEVKPGERLVLKRDPNYWARDLPIMKGLYNFDEIQIDYYRDATAMFEAFKAGLYDFRIETNPTRWISGYDFPRSARRADRQAIGAQRPAQGDGRVRLQHAPPGLRRRAGARGAGDDVRFRMDQRQSLRRRLSPFEEFFRRQRTGVGRTARFAGRARPPRSVPRRGARRRDGGTMGAAGLRRLGPRPGARAPRPRTSFAKAGYVLRTARSPIPRAKASPSKSWSRIARRSVSPRLSLKI